MFIQKASIPPLTPPRANLLQREADPRGPGRRQGQPGRLQEHEQGRSQVVNNMSLHVVLVMVLASSKGSVSVC